MCIITTTRQRQADKQRSLLAVQMNTKGGYPVRIVTDCAADMLKAELQAFDIVEAPLYIQFPEGEVNSADLSPDDFYNRLRAMYPAIPTTAQPSSGVLGQIYQQLAATDDQILSVHISSGLSGTSQAAQLAANALDGAARVNVWDTLTLSGGQRYQVLAAALAARDGWSLSAIQRLLTELRTQTEVIFTLETLDYLARGGRIGRVQALAGSLLKIKPIIRVEQSDGKYSNVGRARNIAQALNQIAEHLRGLYSNQPVWVTIMHGQLAEQAEALSKLLIGKVNVARLETLRVSPVLGVHTGPGVVGVAVTPMKLMEDLLAAQA